MNRLFSYTKQIKEERHVKPYLLTALYNAPLTMDNHYALMVGHDLSGGSG